MSSREELIYMTKLTE